MIAPETVGADMAPDAPNTTVIEPEKAIGPAPGTVNVADWLNWIVAVAEICGTVVNAADCPNVAPLVPANRCAAVSAPVWPYVTVAVPANATGAAAVAPSSAKGAPPSG
jgi:hypothetical protein